MDETKKQKSEAMQLNQLPSYSFSKYQSSPLRQTRTGRWWVATLLLNDAVSFGFEHISNLVTNEKRRL